jgi:hypothetical protein
MPEVSEQHFTPAELAAAWQIDVSTVRRIFIDLPGVLKLGRSIGGRGKRSYVTLRIPREIAERVYRERTR